LWWSIVLVFGIAALSSLIVESSVIDVNAGLLPLTARPGKLFVPAVNEHEDDENIVSGNPSPRGEYPSFAVVNGAIVCGATLIHADLLVSAAHCQPPPPPTPTDTPNTSGIWFQDTGLITVVATLGGQYELCIATTVR
jgi:hypothetical protein